VIYEDGVQIGRLYEDRQASRPENRWFWWQNPQRTVQLSIGSAYRFRPTGLSRDPNANDW
jgi:hypothetical protein